MKKKSSLFLILLMFIVTTGSVNADTSMCAQPPYPVSGAAGTFLSKITGMNFILTKTAENAVERAIKDQLGGDFDVKITPYGGKNLIDGKFQKITGTGENIVVEGVHFSKIEAASLCEYNRFVFKNFYKDVYTAENFLLGYTATISSEDLQKTIVSPEATKIVNSFTKTIGDFVVFKVFNPKASVRGERVFLSMNVISPMFLSTSAKEVSVNMGLSVKDGQIMFSDVKLNNSSKNVDLSTFLPIINKMNPFLYKTNIMDNRNSVIKVNDIKVADSKIVVSGIVIVPKNYEE